MKKQTLMIVAAVGFLIAMSAVSAFAQTTNLANAQVPFDFNVNSKTLPAGKYTIAKPATNGVIIVRSGEKKSAAASLAATTTQATPATRLVFHRYGSQYFLAKIEVEGSNGLELPKTKAERNTAKQANERHLAKNNGEPEIVTVPASL